MKIQCTTKQLLSAVQLAERMAGKQLSLPSLQGVLLQAVGKNVLVRATNLSVGVEVEVGAVVSEEGAVLLRGDVLNIILNNLSSETITLELEHENLRVTTGTTRNVIKALVKDDFPTLPLVEGESFTISSQILQEGIRSVFFASAISDIKPEISSVFIYSDNGNIVFVGTDSFRLAEKKMKVKNITDISKILLPYKSIGDILKVLDETTGDVKVTYNRNQISISTGRIYFTARLIDGAFPDYRTIIPKEYKTKIVLLKQELLATLRLASIFVDKFSQIMLSVVPEKKTIMVNSKNTDVGTSEAMLSAAIEGQSIETTFNLKYFLDVFQAISGDSISLEFTESNKASVVRGVNDTSFIYLLMPTNR